VLQEIYVFFVIYFRDINSRRMRWTVHVVGMEEVRSAHKILVGESKGKRLLGRSIIEIDLKRVIADCEHGNEDSFSMREAG